MARLKFIKDWKVVEIQINDKDPILEQLEKAKLDIKSSCRNGTCGACACKIIKWAENLDPEKFWKNVMELPNFLTCIWWLDSSADKDSDITIEPIF